MIKVEADVTIDFNRFFARVPKSRRPAAVRCRRTANTRRACRRVPSGCATSAGRRRGVLSRAAPVRRAKPGYPRPTCNPSLMKNGTTTMFFVFAICIAAVDARFFLHENRVDLGVDFQRADQFHLPLNGLAGIGVALRAVAGDEQRGVRRFWARAGREIVPTISSARARMTFVIKSCEPTGRQ